MGLFGRRPDAPPADAARLAQLEREVAAVQSRVRTLELEADTLQAKVRKWMRVERAGAQAQGDAAERGVASPPPAPHASPDELSSAIQQLLTRGARGRMAARRLAQFLTPPRAEEEEEENGVHP